MEELENDQIYEVPQTISFCNVVISTDLSVPGAYLMFMFKILNCNENMVRVENINHLNGAIINKEMTRNK